MFKVTKKRQGEKEVMIICHHFL